VHDYLTGNFAIITVLEDGTNVPQNCCCLAFSFFLLFVHLGICRRKIFARKGFFINCYLVRGLKRHPRRKLSCFKPFYQVGWQNFNSRSLGLWDCSTLQGKLTRVKAPIFLRRLLLTRSFQS